MGASCWGLRTDGLVGPQNPVGDLIETGTSGVGDEHLVRDPTGVMQEPHHVDLSAATDG